MIKLLTNYQAAIPDVLQSACSSLNSQAATEFPKMGVLAFGNSSSTGNGTKSSGSSPFNTNADQFAAIIGATIAVVALIAGVLAFFWSRIMGVGYYK